MFGLWKCMMRYFTTKCYVETPRATPRWSLTKRSCSYEFNIFALQVSAILNCVDFLIKSKAITFFREQLGELLFLTSACLIILRTQRKKKKRTTLMQPITIRITLQRRKSDQSWNFALCHDRRTQSGTVLLEMISAGLQWVLSSVCPVWACEDWWCSRVFGFSSEMSAR